MSRRCVIVGTGRAGGSFATALQSVGWVVTGIRGRSVTDGTADTDSIEQALADADVVLIAVPDDAISTVAAALPTSGAVYAHVSGASDLEGLRPHQRVGSLHPLMSLPDAAIGAARLLDACTFAVDGDPAVRDVVAALGGRAVAVAPSDRVLYHAAATVAANHFTALCAQVERLAGAVGVPIDAYWKMMENTLDNVATHGAADALTGPAARGDWDTVRSHLAALPTDADRRLYLAGCEAAAALGGHQLPPDIAAG